MADTFRESSKHGLKKESSMYGKSKHSITKTRQTKSMITRIEMAMVVKMNCISPDQAMSSNQSRSPLGSSLTRACKFVLVLHLSLPSDFTQSSSTYNKIQVHQGYHRICLRNNLIKQVSNQMETQTQI